MLVQNFEKFDLLPVDKNWWEANSVDSVQMSLFAVSDQGLNSLLGLLPNRLKYLATLTPYKIFPKLLTSPFY